MTVKINTLENLHFANENHLQCYIEIPFFLPWIIRQYNA